MDLTSYVHGWRGIRPWTPSPARMRCQSYMHDPSPYLRPKALLRCRAEGLSVALTITFQPVLHLTLRSTRPVGLTQCSRSSGDDDGLHRPGLPLERHNRQADRPTIALSHRKSLLGRNIQPRFPTRRPVIRGYAAPLDAFRDGPPPPGRNPSCQDPCAPWLRTGR
jgi:hypothetical protein